MAFQDPVLEVAAHAVGMAGQRGIKPGDAADQRDKGCQIACGRVALIPVQMRIGTPDGQGGKAGLVGGQPVQHVLDHGKSHLRPPCRGVEPTFPKWPAA